MKLGDYTFDFLPDSIGIPKSEKICAVVKTYTSLAYFSWGVEILGKLVSLSWEWVYADQFNRLQLLYEDDEQKEWDLEAASRIFHGDVDNWPFETGASIIGETSGATALVSGVHTDPKFSDDYIEVTGVAGTFQVGEYFHDDSVPAKRAQVDSLEILPTYTVEILSLDGELLDVHGYDRTIRRNVRMVLIISEERAEDGVSS